MPKKDHEDLRTVPEIRQEVIDAITDMLREVQGVKRPPRRAAHLLAIICKLHEMNKPFPRRKVVAEAIGTTEATVQSALSSKLGDRTIFLEVEVLEGSVKNRASAIRYQHYVPNTKLLQTYRRAEHATPVGVHYTPRGGDRKAAGGNNSG